jgi:hypothetical protein
MLAMSDDVLHVYGASDDILYLRMIINDRSRDVSDALTEVRTVLSRAETAMDALVRLSYRGNRPTAYGVRVPCGDNNTRMEWHYDGPPSGEAPDPDVEDMYYALERTVRDLARWRKAGKGKTR